MESSIVAEKLRVIKQGDVILDDVTFEVAKGSVTGLIGPSGSGKTTLMRAIVGAQKISGGSLQLLGKPAGSASLRKVIGYVPQGSAIYDDLTVHQNLAYFGKIAGANKAQIAEVLDQVQLTSKKDALIAHLSGGQRARVSLAIALLGDAQVLVLDEPTVGLDPLLREELWTLFARLAKQGKTLLVSSHVMDEAERCNDILLLREAKLLWSGAKDELLKATATKTVEAAFLAAIRKKEVAHVSR